MIRKSIYVRFQNWDYLTEWIASLAYQFFFVHMVQFEIQNEIDKLDNLTLNSKNIEKTFCNLRQSFEIIFFPLSQIYAFDALGVNVKGVSKDFKDKSRFSDGLLSEISEVVSFNSIDFQQIYNNDSLYYIFFSKYFQMMLKN